MWQVSGRSDITDFEEVVRLDTEYIENQGRAFIHVNDIVDALVRALEKGWGHGWIQIGPDHSTTIKEIAYKVAEIRQYLNSWESNTQRKTSTHMYLRWNRSCPPVEAGRIR